MGTMRGRSVQLALRCCVEHENNCPPMPPHTPTPSDRPDDVKGPGDEQFNWDLLVSRIVHPIQVVTIEALNWIGLPLAPTDLVEMFEHRPYTSSHIGYHFVALSERNVIELVDTAAVRGATKHFYVLAAEYRCRL